METGIVLKASSGLFPPVSAAAAHVAQLGIHSPLFCSIVTVSKQELNFGSS